MVACPTEPWIRGLWAVAGMDSDDLAPEHLLAASRTSPRGRRLNSLITLIGMFPRVVCAVNPLPGLQDSVSLYRYTLCILSCLMLYSQCAVVLAISDFL